MCCGYDWAIPNGAQISMPRTHLWQSSGNHIWVSGIKLESVCVLAQPPLFLYWFIIHLQRMLLKVGSIVSRIIWKGERSLTYNLWVLSVCFILKREDFQGLLNHKFRGLWFPIIKIKFNLSYNQMTLYLIPLPTFLQTPKKENSFH